MKTSCCAAVRTACSPLTARLSMTMSLYGRRPRVVRSFVIWNSLITTLSSETTSLPIEDLLFRRPRGHSPETPQRPCCSSDPSSPEGPPGLAECTCSGLGARQHHRDIIPPARRVGGLD